MWYRCKECDYEEARGCIPGVSCGIYLISLSVFPAFVIGVVLGWLRGCVEIDGFGWWWVLIVPLMIIVSFVLISPVAYFFEFLEYLVLALRKCRRCGARRWSRGYTKGFGL